jgi:hypothetical protein
VVAGALGTWLRSRGLQTLDLEPIACVPISVRDDGGRAEVVPAFIPLPVGARDPEDRVRRVREATAAATAQLSPLGADEIVELEDFAPPNLLAEASRASFTGRRPYDLLAINVPGPQQPLYLAGRRLEWLAPIGFLPESNALVIVAMSYDGHLEFGFLGDYEAVPDLDRFEGFVADALAELL